MQENNTTNLPILDDIIKPGDADKVVHQPSGKLQSSILSDDKTSLPSSTDKYAETDLHTEIDEPADIPELFSEDEPIQQEVYAEAGQSQQSPIDLPDIDTLTAEILDNMMLEMEQILRKRIQQTLKKHLSGEAKSG
jgi:hypothetical protein